MNPESNLTDTDTDRLTLLDRIAERVPELDLDEQTVEWTTMDDGAEAPLIEGHIGCVVIRPDGSRYLARVMPDPLAPQ